MRKYKSWTREQLQLILKLSEEGKSYAEVAKIAFPDGSRSKSSIMSRLKQMRLRIERGDCPFTHKADPGAYSEEDEEIIIENYYTLGALAVSKMIGRTKKAVNHRAIVLRRQGRLISPEVVSIKKAKSREKKVKTAKVTASIYGLDPDQRVAIKRGDEWLHMSCQSVTKKSVYRYEAAAKHAILASRKSGMEGLSFIPVKRVSPNPMGKAFR